MDMEVTAWMSMYSAIPAQQDKRPFSRAVLLAGSVAGAVRQGPVVADHLVDHEAEEALREHRVQIGLDRQPVQPLDLAGLPLRVGRRHPVRGLQRPYLLGALEALGEQMDDGG